MRKSLLVLSTILAFASMPAQTRAQIGFATGLALGSTMSSGQNKDTQGSETNLAILYEAPIETMKAIDPLAIRFVHTRFCHLETKSLGELFDVATERLPKENRTLVQIIRLFNIQPANCFTLWFAYVRK